MKSRDLTQRIINKLEQHSLGVAEHAHNYTVSKALKTLAPLPASHGKWTHLKDDDRTTQITDIRQMALRAGITIIGDKTLDRALEIAAAFAGVTPEPRIFGLYAKPKVPGYGRHTRAVFKGIRDFIENNNEVPIVLACQRDKFIGPLLYYSSLILLVEKFDVNGQTTLFIDKCRAYVPLVSFKFPHALITEHQGLVKTAEPWP